jgi:acetyl esterase/lipase
MKIRRVVGDSMKPALFEGDIVVVKKTRSIQKGDIVVARKGSREVITRVEKITKKRVYLVGDNKKASTDSRTYGWVSKRDVIGTAVFAVGASRFKLARLSRTQLAVAASLSVFALALIGVFAVYNFDISRIKQVASAGPAIQPVKQQELRPKYTTNTVRRDIPYCNDQALDIYYPRTAVYEKAPSVIYMHGGGWQINTKSSETNQLAVIDGLRDEGFAVISIDYRKLPEYYFPKPVSDALCSVRFLRANNEALGIDSEKIGIYGFSAGGHLAAMVGLLDSQNEFNEGPYKEQSSRVKAVATLAGIFSFEEAVRYNNELKIRYFMNGADTKVGQPISYVSPDDPPFLLVHGLQDQYVAPEQDQVLSGALKTAGVTHTILHVQNAEHGLGPVEAGAPTPSNEQTSKAIRDFLKKKILE